MAQRTDGTGDPSVGRTTLVSRNWRWSNVPLSEAHIGLLTVGVVTHVVRPWSLGSGRPMRRVGWSLIVTGVALAAWATREADGIDLARPDRVATSGPYAVSRHPMYVAWTLVFVGVALVLDTVWLVVLLAPLAAVIHREARAEEERLATVFGVGYETYRTRVRRYL